MFSKQKESPQFWLRVGPALLTVDQHWCEFSCLLAYTSSFDGFNEPCEHASVPELHV